VISPLNQSRDFRFELSWISHSEFLPKVKEIWQAPTRDSISLDRILFKLKKVKKYLKGWGFNLSGMRKQRKKVIQDTLEKLEKVELDPLNADQVKERLELKLELFNILDEEALFWFKMCHETWLLKGDNNTEFFHRIANGKRRKQTTFSLQNGDQMISGTEQLLLHVITFYKDLFGPGEGNAFNLDPGLWPAEEMITSQGNSELTKPFHEEVNHALFLMEKNKAAGSHGMSIEFYQSCWEFIKDDIMEMFGDLYIGKLDVKRLDYGIITLLPKVKDAIRIQQYRPIC
jgi:hypothetical protein